MKRTLLIIGSVVVVAAAVIFFYPKPEVVNSAVIDIQGMTCSGCVAHVTSSLLHIDGVKTAEVSLEKREARVQFVDGKTDLDTLEQAIVKAGYAAKAKDSATTESSTPQEKSCGEGSGCCSPAKANAAS